MSLQKDQEEVHDLYARVKAEMITDATLGNIREKFDKKVEELKKSGNKPTELELIILYYQIKANPNASEYAIDAEKDYNSIGFGKAN